MPAAMRPAILGVVLTTGAPPVPRPARREIALVCAIAAATAGLLAAFGPAPEDAPVHLYRLLLLREGAVVWDNLWYAGHYPLSYGVLFPLLAALAGPTVVVVGGVVASAAAFAALCARRFGDAGPWPARVFAALAAAPLFTGLDSYALGLACALGALLALQCARPWTGGALAALALAASPLAFAFLCLVLAGVVAAPRVRRPDRRLTLRAGLAVALVAAVGAGALGAFPNGGVYPFPVVSLVAAVALSAAGSALAWRAPEARPLAVVLALWGLACLASFAVASPVGENMARLRGLALPVTLIAAILAGFRPRWLAVAALALAAANNVGPYLALVPDQLDGRPAERAFWAPTIDYLAANRAPGYRVEVVPTATHWEAYWLPRAGVPLARGWFRQLDAAELYDGDLDRAGYLAWLRLTGTGFVVLPHTRLDPDGGAEEARIVRASPGDLRPVLRGADATVYAVRGAPPMLTGAPGDRITAVTHTAIAGHLATGGPHLLRVRYMRYWSIVAGDVCLRPGPDGMTTVVARLPGAFRLEVDQSPAALLDRAVDDQDEIGDCGR